MIDEPAVVHATMSELSSELFWALHIDPVARAHGMQQPMQLDARDPGRHLLKHPDGRVLLIVFTDRQDA